MKFILLFAGAVLMLMPSAANCTAQSVNTQSEHSTEESVNIILTIGNKAIPAILYNTAPARDLMKRLPVTVSLNRGSVDYCGSIKPIAYSEKDAQTGYRAGDLAYWIPGKDFVIFTEDKTAASGTPDLVIIGQVSTDIEEIRNLGSTISVSISLAHGLPLSDMQVRITSGGHTASFRLYNTVAAEEFFNQLPLRLDLSNFRDAQWMFYPPEKLNVTAREAYHDGKKGELSYYEPWGDVFMLYKDFYAGDEMHRLGINVDGIGEIEKMSGKVTIQKKNANVSGDQGNMTINVVANGRNTVFRLNNSTAARELYSQLPLNINVENYGSNEKIFYPPNKLNTADAPQADADTGTLAYYAPWGNVVMFYGRFGSAPGLYELGHAVFGGENINGMSGIIQVEKGTAR